MTCESPAHRARSSLWRARQIGESGVVTELPSPAGARADRGGGPRCRGRGGGRPLPPRADPVRQLGDPPERRRRHDVGPRPGAPRRPHGERLVDAHRRRRAGRARRPHRRTRSASRPLDPGLAGRGPARPRRRRSPPSTRRRPTPRPTTGPRWSGRSSTPPAGWRRPATAARTIGRGRSSTRPARSSPARAPRRAWTASPARRGVDGVARLASPRLADIDGAVLGARAAAKVRAGADPVELPPGRYEVVLEPSAVADVLQNLARVVLQRQGRDERRSFAELGAAQFDATVTLVDDPLAAGDSYDAEGTPHQRLCSSTPGRRWRCATTAARRPKPARPRPATPPARRRGARPAPPAAARPPAGDAAAAVTEVDGPVADSAVAALVAGVARGVLVTDFWYTRVLDPKTLADHRPHPQRRVADRGRRGHPPLRNFRFTQSYGQALDAGRRARGRCRRRAPSRQLGRRRGGRPPPCTSRRGTSRAGPAVDGHVPSRQSTERAGSSHTRPAWPGNAMTVTPPSGGGAGRTRWRARRPRSAA